MLDKGLMKETSIRQDRSTLKEVYEYGREKNGVK